MLQVVSSVVAPTTLLTAVLFYFGWNYSYWFFDHFGVDISLVGLTTQDYMMRSVDALFVPMVVLLSAGLLLLWVHAGVAPGFFDGREGPARARTAVAVLGGLGLVLFSIGMAAVFVPALKGTYHLFYPVSLGAGTLLMLYASRMQRRAREVAGATAPLQTVALLEGTAAFLLVSLSLFWAATNYAADVGEARARQFEQELEGLPSAIVYSKESLNLDSASVEEVACPESEGGYRFRYAGLRLMLRSGGQYIFLPDGWSPAEGVAMVIPESDAVRLELSRADRSLQQPGPTC